MNTRKRDYFFTALGIILLVAGLILLNSFPNAQGIWLRLPFVCIGIGSGVFGLGMGNLISGRVMKNNPLYRKQVEIDQKDERNITINSFAKAKAYDVMTFVLGALMLSFALMGVDTTATLLLVFAYLFIHGYKIYYHHAFNKEM